MGEFNSEKVIYEVLSTNRILPRIIYNRMF